MIGLKAERKSQEGTSSFGGSGRRPQILWYLHDFLGNLPGFVDIQDDLGVPHHRIERPSLAEAEKQKDKRSRRQLLR